MNESNDENLTPMIIMRKKSSLVNLNDKREKISSSVEIRGKLSNYTFSVNIFIVPTSSWLFVII